MVFVFQSVGARPKGIRVLENRSGADGKLTRVKFIRTDFFGQAICLFCCMPYFLGFAFSCFPRPVSWIHGKIFHRRGSHCSCTASDSSTDQPAEFFSLAHFENAPNRCCGWVIPLGI